MEAQIQTQEPGEMADQVEAVLINMVEDRELLGKATQADKATQPQPRHIQAVVGAGLARREKVLIQNRLVVMVARALTGNRSGITMRAAVAAALTTRREAREAWEAAVQEGTVRSLITPQRAGYLARLIPAAAAVLDR